MPINTILFDFVGVLFFPKRNRQRNFLVDEIDQHIGSVTNDSTFRKMVLQKYGLSDVDFKEILQAVVDKYEPYLPLWELLPELRSDYKLGIINNGTQLTYPFFEEKYHMSLFFDVFLSSAVEGVCKPDRLIYLRACQRIGSKPGDCLFMDDNRENIAGAQVVGIQTIHWVNKKMGLQEFNARLAAVKNES